MNRFNMKTKDYLILTTKEHFGYILLRIVMFYRLWKNIIIIYFELYYNKYVDRFKMYYDRYKCRYKYRLKR